MTWWLITIPVMLALAALSLFWFMKARRLRWEAEKWPQLQKLIEELEVEYDRKIKKASRAVTNAQRCTDTIEKFVVNFERLQETVLRRVGIPLTFTKAKAKRIAPGETVTFQFIPLVPCKIFHFYFYGWNHHNVVIRSIRVGTFSVDLGGDGGVPPEAFGAFPIQAPQVPVGVAVHVDVALDLNLRGLDEGFLEPFQGDHAYIGAVMFVRAGDEDDDED